MRPTRQSTPRRPVSERAAAWRRDVRVWAQSLRFSALTVLIVVLLITAVVVLTPSVSLYLQQQREIAQRRESVELHRSALEKLEQEQLKWEDPVYIRAQARERLFYVMPGEVQLAVIEDGVIIPEDTTDEVSSELTRTTRDWLRDLTSSLLIAGTAEAEPVSLTER